VCGGALGSTRKMKRFKDNDEEVPETRRSDEGNGG
jgi:hypothetical protein